MATHEEAACEGGPVKLAIFDFDGTSIDGNSPVVLVRWLVGHGQLGPTYLARILGWGICYELHLPQNESWVRSLVFSAFQGMNVDEVDEFLYDFYDKKLERIFRKDAHDAMQAAHDEGCKVMLVSATFEPLILQCMKHHPVDYQISTQMKQTEDGRYTNEVEGLPVEGEQKLKLATEFADREFGPGNWEVVYAYGDHYSDKAMLESAKHPHAVDPDKTLTRYAKLKGWPILKWE